MGIRSGLWSLPSGHDRRDDHFMLLLHEGGDDRAATRCSRRLSSNDDDDNDSSLSIMIFFENIFHLTFLNFAFGTIIIEFRDILTVKRDRT